MDLDETDPAGWLRLESATEKYVETHSEAFRSICERLMLPSQHDEISSDNVNLQQHPLKPKSDENCPSLGWRRNVLLVEATNSPDSGRVVRHARSLETFCSHKGIKLCTVTGFSNSLKPTFSSLSFASPMFTGSFPSSPKLYDPDIGLGRVDLGSPISSESQPPGKISFSSPKSPTIPRLFSQPVQSLIHKLHNSPQVGVVHLALQSDTTGVILGWQNDVFVVAEPGELADKFLRSVRFSLLPTLWSRKEISKLNNISTIADLVAFRPYFQIGCIVHRYIGRQTQVMEDDGEIGAYMFRRTVPSIHLMPDDVRRMVGVWRDRIVICTGRYGLAKSLIKAFLDSGTKAVICPSTEPPQTQATTSLGSCEFDIVENVKFELGEEEAEDEEVEPVSPISDWEDIDMDKSMESPQSKGFCDLEEEELSRFVFRLYESLFVDGANVNSALQTSLSSHRKLRYSCHLPSMMPY